MFNRKFMLIAVFLVGLLAMSAVSASDENITDDVISQEMAIDEELEITQNDTVSANDAEGTFTDLQNMIDTAEEGSTITLDKDYAYDEGFENSQIQVFKNVTIEGNGHKLNALGKSGIFYVRDEVVLNNITFCNAYDNEAIYHKTYFGQTTGQPIISNCIFINNTSISGGAIAIGGNRRYIVEIVNCTFVDNHAKADWSYATGGAISVGESECRIVNSTFVNNSAIGYGGAIYVGTNSHVWVRESEFIGNRANEGGAIYVQSCTQKQRYSNGITDELISVSGNLNVMDNSKFINNMADYGGAICMDTSYSHIHSNLGSLRLYDNVTFKNNTAFVNGSALYLSGTYFNIGSDFNENDVSFINNHGVVIFLDDLNLGNLSVDYDMHKAYFHDNYDPNFGGAISVNDDVISVKFDSSFTGKTYMDIGYERFDVDCLNGTVEVNLNDMNISSGNKRIIVYCKDGSYSASVDFPVTVESKVSILASDVTKYCGGSEKWTVSLTENGKALANKNVNVTVNGKISTVKTDSKGQTSVDLNLGVGNYTVTAKYEDASVNSKVTVKSTIATYDASGTYLNSKVSATFLNTDGKALASKQVSFKVGDKTYTATTNANGVASANIDLGVGSYNVVAINPVNSEQKTFKLVISKAKSTVSLASAQSNGATTLTATLHPSATGNVVFSINGENKTSTIKNGKATLILSDLKAGNCTVSASYNGDNNLNASTSNTVTFKVAEVYPVLTAKEVTKTYGTSTKLVVYLKDNKGNAIANAYVKVVIGKAVKNIKTDSKGKATLTIGYAPGSYNAKITYGTAQTTSKITVKKATPKITAKAKTFKKSVKTKKYTVKMNVKQKVKVAIKVNKKTYYAYTNTKGQATFKITKLTKKGKYTATVSSTANKCYNKAKPVNVKITVK